MKKTIEEIRDGLCSKRETININELIIMTEYFVEKSEKYHLGIYDKKKIRKENMKVYQQSLTDALFYLGEYQKTLKNTFLINEIERIKGLEGKDFQSFKSFEVVILIKNIVFLYSYQKRYYIENKESVSESQKSYYHNNLGKYKNYYKTNGNKIKEKQKNYHRTKKGRVTLTKKICKRNAMKSKTDIAKERNLFKLGCMENGEQTENEYWKGDKEERKIEGIYSEILNEVGNGK